MRLNHPFSGRIETSQPRDHPIPSMRWRLFTGDETVEHPFGTMKARIGAIHFLTKTLLNVATEMALSVLAYNLTRVANIVGVKPFMAAIGA